MHKFKIIMVCFLIFLMLSSLVFPVAAKQLQLKPVAFPAARIGKWQVTQVLTDKGDEETGHLVDANIWIRSYLGRIFTIRPTQLSNNISYENACEDPSFLACKSTAAQIIADSILSRASGTDHPTPQDMGLALADDASVELLYLTCKGEFVAKDKSDKVYYDLSNAIWLMDLGEKQLAMPWREETVLILTRVPENAKPVASFNCVNARTTTEKAICADVGLAAYDTILAQTYKLALSYYQSEPDAKSKVDELKSAQKKWMAHRDQCGNNVVCLEKVMDTRIADLIKELDNSIFVNDLNNYILQNQE